MSPCCAAVTQSEGDEGSVSADEGLFWGSAHPYANGGTTARARRLVHRGRQAWVWVVLVVVVLAVVGVGVGASGAGMQRVGSEWAASGQRIEGSSCWSKWWWCGLWQG